MTPLGHVALRLGAPIALARNQARRLIGRLTTAQVPGSAGFVRLRVELHDGRELYLDLDAEQARGLAEQLIVRVHMHEQLGSTPPAIERAQAKQAKQ